MTTARKRDLRRRFGSQPMPAIVSRPGARFYVTVKRGVQVGWLLGPYVSHMTALTHVERGRRMAQERFPHLTAFAAYGTASRRNTVKTVFGR